MSTEQNIQGTNHPVHIGNKTSGLSALTISSFKNLGCWNWHDLFVSEIRIMLLPYPDEFV